MISKQAHEKSTTFVDTNYRKKWEDSLLHFQNKHASGSKYLRPAYKYRSKIFRPKTRATIRNNEAAAAAAFFTNTDVVVIEPQNESNNQQKASAEINTEILNYRLQNTIPWFLICIGAFQDAQVVGVVCSYQSWKYQEKVETYVEDVFNPETGEDEQVKTREKTTVKDCPSIELIPVENIRISPSALWTDPIGTSPYIIWTIPMYVKDIKRRMNEIDTKSNQPKWTKLTDDQLRSSSQHPYDSTRMTREKGREDKTITEHTKEMGDYDIVWVHMNIINHNGEDIVYYTAGTEYMLSDPVSLETMYFHGERPFVMGYSLIETHKAYPSGLAELGKNIQQEINEVANQRLDNVKLVLNKRWSVKRGSQVDVKSITRNVPGSVTFANDPLKDIVAHEFSDVTGSSYLEQDRLNVDYDELVGNFSTSSVQTNRQLNETATGMKMMKGASNALIEYTIKTFAETWVEPVIKQLLKLEQAYETDEVVLSIAAEKAQLYQKYGINEITDELLNQSLTTTIHLGSMATDPGLKLNQFLGKITSFVDIMKNMPMGLNVEEIAKEIFGKKAKRFIMGEDGKNAQMQGMIEQMQKTIAQLEMQLKEKMTQEKTKVQVSKMKEAGQDRRTFAELENNILLKRMDIAGGNRNV